ncbi:MAG: hypothetical protein RL329_3251, partial [Bacteroidota bacterium]
MMYLFNSKNALSFRLYFLSLCLCLWIPLWSQTDKLAVLLGTKDPDEVSFAKTALANLKKEDYVYLVIYASNDKDKFAIFSSGKIRPKSPIEFVPWLLDPAKNVDQLDPNKDIVLLSSVNSTAAQSFADVFGENDKKANRRIRKIISWDEDVLLYQNGTFKAYGLCYEYQWNRPRKALMDDAIPTGTLVTKTQQAIPSDFIVLSQAPNTLREWLRDWTPLETKDDIMESAKDLKRKNLKLYNELLQNKRCFMMGWRYLWELEYKSELVANFDFLCNVATIQEQYTQNKRLHQDSMASYQASFVRFIKKGGTKEKVLKDLIVPSLLP